MQTNIAQLYNNLSSNVFDVCLGGTRFESPPFTPPIAKFITVLLSDSKQTQRWYFKLHCDTFFIYYFKFITL